MGSTALSLAILLATFLGGLGLGSYVAPRFVAPGKNPLRVYAVLEIGVGALALLELLLIPAVQTLYAGVGAHGALGLALRAIVSAICLLPPAMLMGAALPAVARAVESSPRGVRWLGVLYAGNTLGGIAGCLGAGVLLLQTGDIVRTTLVGVGANALAAVGALIASRGMPREALRVTRAAVTDDEGAVNADRWVLVVIALSGFTALGAEVVWTRLLALLLGATVYTFAIVLGVFLAGIAAGSATIAMVTLRRPRRALVIVQLLLVPAIAWGAWAIGRSLPFWPIAPSLTLSPWFSFQLDLVRVAWAVFPAAVLWGASFPLALAAAAGPGRDTGALVGRVYAANTLGAIAGALVFSLVLVPALGSGHVQQVLAAIAALAGLPLLFEEPKEGRRGALALAVSAALLVAVPIVLAMPEVPGSLVAYGRSLAYRLGAWDPRTNARFTPDLLFVGEGLNESVAVSEERGVRLFHVSGKIEASTAPRDMRLQRMLGHLPALVAGEPKSVLVVGCGAGVTAGAFTRWPSVKRIVICELEPLVPRKIAPYFAAENFDVVHDPRVTIVHDDARHFLLTTRETFDVITSDPIHPWVRGSAALYSRDYFELVKRHLNPGGAVSQWVPLYQATEPTIRGEIATFAAAFPFTSVWANNDRGQGYDMVLLGTPQPTRIDLDRTAARLADAAYAGVTSSLAAVGFPSLPALLATYVTRRSDLAPWLAGASIDRDWQPWLQYRAGLESYTEQEADIEAKMSEYRVFPEDLFTGSPALKKAVKDAGAAPSGE